MRRSLNQKLAVSLGWACCCHAALAADGPLELRSDRVTVRLGREERGGIVSLKTSEGVEFAALQKSPRLFTLTFSQKAETPGEKIMLSSGDAATFDAAVQEEAGGACATLAYEGFSKGVARVVCTARVKTGDPLVRWGIVVQMRDGWVLESVQYPFVVLSAPLGSSVEDDAAVVGSAKGGVIRQPGSMKAGSSVSIGQPGNMAAQFGCYYDDRAGFYTAAEDGRGTPKDLILTRAGAGMEFSWFRPCFAAGAVTQAYDVVMSSFGGSDGAPADWRDAADLYKAWALTQPWCATPFAQRGDLPAWLKDGPAMVRFGRDWLADPSRIERWLTEYWKKQFPEMPLITAYWGWEKRGSWVTPDYFPLFPSDEQFTQLVAKTRKLGCHAFPWPSGYHWTLTYNKRPDGSFEWDDRARFDEVARTHAVHNRDGSLYLRVPSWLNGGNTACQCGGDPWTIRWWNEDISVPLARRGCEMVQVDQVVGGNWPACYATNHGHPQGRGPWMTEAFAEQLRTMLSAMRAVEPDAVVCFEEPNEWFNHLVGLQDYRDCESPREWASVFNYLYHEYLPPFQSNPRGNDRVMNAHCAADGQMPHLVPTGRDLADDVIVNGVFEARAAGANAFAGWEHLRGYQGVAWNGQAFSDRDEKHGGAASLRLENTNRSDIVQVSQNVDVDDRGFAVGGKYRLSAWLKTDHMAQPDGISFGVFAPGLKSTGQGGHLKYPAAGAGWTRVSADFTVPAGAEMMRIMCNARDLAKVWVDDVTLEAVQPDGSARPVRFEGLSSDGRFMRRWVTLYHGEGRPWLQNGRLLHPPKLACATITYRDRPTPAVFHNAFRSPDGKIAVVLANATREPQTVTLSRRGKSLEVMLGSDDVVLIKGASLPQAERE
jgi:hypothetical protein